MQPPLRIPESLWRRLDPDERRLITAHVETLVYRRYKYKIALVITRAWINRIYELIPAPVLFALLAAIFSFLFLFLMPIQPVSMFIAMSLGIVLALIVKILLLIATW